MRPTDLDSLVAYLEKHPLVYCEHPRLEAQGLRIFESYEPGKGLWFTKGDGGRAFIPLHRPNQGCGKGNIGFTPTHFAFTMFGTQVKYLYLPDDYTLTEPHAQQVAQWAAEIEASCTPGQALAILRLEEERKEKTLAAARRKVADVYIRRSHEEEETYWVDVQSPQGDVLLDGGSTTWPEAEAIAHARSLEAEYRSKGYEIQVVFDGNVL